MAHSMSNFNSFAEGIMKASDYKKKITVKRKRGASAGCDEEIGEDVNLLGKPMNVGLQGVQELLKAVTQGTDQVGMRVELHYFLVSDLELAGICLRKRFRYVHGNNFKV